METITIDFDIPGLEISTDNRWELSRVVDTALQDSGGRWTGCQYTEDTLTIHAVVEDEEQARSLIRSAIEGHPVFSHTLGIFSPMDGHRYFLIKLSKSPSSELHRRRKAKWRTLNIRTS